MVDCKECGQRHEPWEACKVAKPMVEAPPLTEEQRKAAMADWIDWAQVMKINEGLKDAAVRGTQEGKTYGELAASGELDGPELLREVKPLSKADRYVMTIPGELSHEEYMQHMARWDSWWAPGKSPPLCIMAGGWKLEAMSDLPQHQPLPGKYAIKEVIDNYNQTITFQTLEEMNAHLREEKKP